MPSIALKNLGRGRLLLLLAAGITILGDSAVTIITAPYLAPAMAEGAVVRVLITLALFYAIWRGLRWARWLVVSLLALGLCLTIPMLIRTMHPLMIGVALQFAIAIGLLAFSPSVAAFLAEQRSRYRGSA